MARFKSNDESPASSVLSKHISKHDLPARMAVLTPEMLNRMAGLKP